MPTIRLQALPRFPASVEAGDGIIVTRSNGVFTFALDPDSAPEILGFVADTRTIGSGAGLIGGGDLSNNLTLAVGAGTGITVSDSDVALTVPVAIAFGGTGGTTQATAQIALGVREKLTGNRNYFVRADGSDGNTGLVDLAGGAFLTIQKAIDTIWKTLDVAGFAVAIVVGAGTYTAPIVVSGKHVGGGSITLVGDTSTPANVIISTTSSNALLVTHGAAITATGFEFRTTTSGDCISVANGGNVTVLNHRFGASAGSHFAGASSGIVLSSGSYTIAGSARSHIHFGQGAFFQAAGGTITLSGTPPAFADFFIGMSENATAKFDTITFSGAATGTRFFIHTGAMVNIGGTGNLTYFPGNVAGIYSEGGIYDIFFGANTFAQTQTFSGVVAANFTGAILFGGNSALNFVGGSTPYVFFQNAAGVNTFIGGGGGASPDNTNYYNNNAHIFRTAAGSAHGSIATTGATFASGTAIPAGGTTGTGVRVSSTANFGVFFGSGPPTLSAAKGSLYLRSDGSGTGDRAYINTNGSTTWTALTTAA